MRKSEKNKLKTDNEENIKLTKTEEEISRLIIKEIKDRLNFLKDVSQL